MVIKMMIFKKIAKFFKQEKKCDCVMASSEDPLNNKLFKHYKNQRLYRYLFAATSKDLDEKLVVVYQDVQNKKRYTRPWNEFFASVGADKNRVPRFEEQT